ncbi:phage-associated cell wall hydrolase [Streptococcus pseudoporcinus]|uniref:Phage-associated cell wall hydrolase n=1 Tax=Streptococcus pseudoporcinus TaxID=361101 RepID=A0A4U9Y2Q7_9STRE|nr:SH3 domain-containing protein [Streptococcus pseudoporcinus]QBX18739.1 peptidoglycan hydrolase [Streptococcus phage Javan443]QBX18742.1 peptidoglycan hydrolase [Streptococcus phage Javan445]VTS14226.1 phage-associated cell wall hydrolase [Streptococcus pseudoporcinus]VTS14999.1 phage-associated cell wall hydrolase [Streptococcus pseudoporcinus]VTS20269.1 phage-associated cell wall hydrolase [Streptococcus pseudoporcinus]
MATNQDVANWALSKSGQRLSVDTNPYGSQCVVFPDLAARTFTGKNMSYTNAIDLLARASANGFEVFSNGLPKTGHVFVIKANGHEFGHTGLVVVDSDGNTLETMETNVDGNYDCLYVGGPARRKSRIWRGNALIDDQTGFILGWMIGWYRMFPDTSTISKAETIQAIKKKRRNNKMFGSFIFSVKEGDNEFIKGAVYLYNSLTNTVTGLHNQEEVKYVSEWYKEGTDESIPMKTFSTQAPTYRRLFAGLGTDTTNSRLKNVVSDLKDDIEEGLAKFVKGNDIAVKQSFTAIVNLNIRDAASAKGKILGRLNKGEAVEIVGSASSEGYYWISFERNGKLCYVASKVEGGDIYGTIK